MNRYRSGADFERRICKHLTDYGALCVRAAGSHGIADVIALWPQGPAWLIQAKVSGKMARDEVKALHETAHKYGLVPIKASRHLGKIRFERHHQFGDAGYQWSDVTP